MIFNLSCTLPLSLFLMYRFIEQDVVAVVLLVAALHADKSKRIHVIVVRCDAHVKRLDE